MSRSKKTEFDIGQTGKSKCVRFSSTHQLILLLLFRQRKHIYVLKLNILLSSLALSVGLQCILRASQKVTAKINKRRRRRMFIAAKIFLHQIQSTRDTYRLRYFAVMSATVFVPIYPACLSAVHVQNSAAVDSIISCICYSFIIHRVACVRWVMTTAPTQRNQARQSSFMTNISCRPFECSAHTGIHSFAHDARLFIK